jgi:hypothetical protein
VAEAEADIRSCLAAGAHNVQIDFTEGRLAVKLDPSKRLLHDFVALNNRVLERFGPAERERLGVHTCPGGDHDSTHSADVDYAELLPSLFELKVRNFYVQLASERDRGRALDTIGEYLRPGQVVFLGVIDPIDPRVESPEEVCQRVLEPPSAFRWPSSARPTIVASPRSETTSRPPGRPRLRRSAPASLAPSSPPKSSGSEALLPRHLILGAEE